ncbi:Hypothetical protein SMAX5B_005263 [Scophthalmus maximus]|uniref:Uncharacterized protein n=1 Tax=Scophthalmus maximus TaxID=52904 RepID=A0A2U9CGV3_SCOMX|nr:Hypothetical protein SMAX5B_005263 [Scophthalmus maximus]
METHTETRSSSAFNGSEGGVTWDGDSLHRARSLAERLSGAAPLLDKLSLATSLRSAVGAPQQQQKKEQSGDEEETD